MSFRGRLVLFLVVTLVAVQGLTALVGYEILRANAVAEGRSELVGAADALQRQLDVISRRVTDDVQVLSLDYALRQAIALRDSQTEISALRNHGNRVGATRMMLVGLDGRITVDTGRGNAAGQSFPFGDLLDAAAASNKGAALAALDGKIYWIAVVPVLAPVPIAFIAACVPVDDALLKELQLLSATKRAMALYIGDGDTKHLVAKSADFLALNSRAGTEANGDKTSVMRNGAGAEFLALTVPLSSAAQSDRINAEFSYPLSDALQAYRSISIAMLIMLVAALVVALGGALLIARSVARPLESLALVARRIAAGDYAPPPRRAERDELGHLSDALINMTQSIADREAALTGAIEVAEHAREAAVTANDAKSQFLANISHELRTPLNAVIGFSDILRDQIMGPLGAACYVDYARDIHDSGNRLLELVEEMITLSSAQAGQLKIAKHALNIDTVLADSLATLRHVAQKSNIELVTEGDISRWPEIKGDAAKLKQAFSNIIHNAIKFTPSKGRITIHGSRAHAWLTIAIADNGIGIRAEDLAVVLRPFHRLRSALDGRHQGAGLGLPFAKAIVEGHGGVLTVESTLGRGTVVRIELPVDGSHEFDGRREAA